MATNIEIDEKLVSRAMRLGKLKTKKDAVNRALEEFVSHREQMKILDLFGTVEMDETYDYKKQRKVQ